MVTLVAALGLLSVRAAGGVTVVSSRYVFKRWHQERALGLGLTQRALMHRLDLLTMGIGQGLPSFVLLWTIVYNLVHTF